MSEKKYVVPEGMLEAFRKAENHPGFKWDDGALDKMLEAALKWLAENPIPCPVLVAHEILHSAKAIRADHDYDYFQFGAVEWQRRMFLAPEPESPEAIKDLLDEWSGTKPNNAMQIAILEAYRRGQKAGAK